MKLAYDKDCAYGLAVADLSDTLQPQFGDILVLKHGIVLKGCVTVARNIDDGYVQISLDLSTPDHTCCWYENGPFEGTPEEAIEWAECNLLSEMGHDELVALGFVYESEMDR